MTTLKYSNTDSISFAQDSNNATNLILTVNNNSDTCGGTVATFTNAVITGIDTSGTSPMISFNSDPIFSIQGYVQESSVNLSNLEVQANGLISVSDFLI